MKERAQELLDQVAAVRESEQDYDLTDWQRAELSGIQQTVSWLLEPDQWMHPLLVAGVRQES